MGYIKTGKENFLSESSGLARNLQYVYRNPLNSVKMKASTFPMNNENEATALVTFFNECGISASRKGLVVKAVGEPKLVGHLFDIFIINALV